MKRFIALILVLLMCISLVACSENYDKWDNDQIEAYGFVTIDQLGRYGESACYLVYDPITKVEYIVTSGSYNNFSFCPYYGKDGNVVIYGGK